MKKRRLLLFNNMMTPYTSRLWERLSEEFEVLVCSCARQESNRSWASDFSNSFSHTILNGFSIRLSPARYAHFNYGFRRVIKEFKPDLVICNGFYPTMAGIVITCIAFDIPYIVQNDGWAETMPRSLYHLVVRSFILRHARGVIACSERGAGYFCKQGLIKDNVFVAHLAPAWDPPAFVLPYEERKFDLLWVAQTNVEVKNCLFFVQVVQELVRRGRQLKVCVVGDGPDRQTMIHRLSIESNVALESFARVNWDEIANFFQNSKAFLLPSRWEPWGLVCNEAMQCGTPCVVSVHVGAAYDLVECGGGLVPDLNVEAWADSCELLLDLETWTKRSEKARWRTSFLNFENYVSGYLIALRTFTETQDRFKIGA